MLRVLCRDPHNPDKVVGESTIQFMSLDQDPSDFASGDFHICAHDEPPSLAIWRENEARTMRVDGRLLLAMTWPDDPSINVGWLYDEVYEPGRSGRDPIDHLDRALDDGKPALEAGAVSAQAEKWSTEITNVRIYGRPIRFSNRVHPDFTDNTKTWCFPCGKSVVRVPNGARPMCGVCGSESVVDYNHVQEFGHFDDLADRFPARSSSAQAPHDAVGADRPADDWWIVADGKCEGDCVQTRDYAHRLEREMGLFVAQRYMDPNMGASPSGQRREVTWQDEFAAAKLAVRLADDIDVGRSRLNTMMRPDPQTLRPRIEIHPRCKDTVYQLNRYVWADFSKNVDRDLKQTPKDTHDDFPDLAEIPR
jgi:hypothetical protein